MGSFRLTAGSLHLHRQFNFADFINELSRLLALLKEREIECFIYKPFQEYLIKNYEFETSSSGSFEYENELPKDISLLLSLGGDGTFLKSFLIAQNRSIPLMGVNSGRLGFLSDVSRDEIDKAITDILDGNYFIDERTVLELEFEREGGVAPLS